MNKRGFTLVELLIVIAIIGILAAIATTAYVGMSKKATRSEAYTNLDSIRLLEEQFFSERAVYTASAANGPAIRALLPGFNPGGNPPGSGIHYMYAVTQNVALVPPVAVPFGGATVAQTPCFVATATGLAGSRAAGDVFAIDCNNNRNF